jgi:DNA-binding NarL/FixJ family response regulator
MNIRVYIVDDHPLIIDGFRLNFDGHRRISIVGSHNDPKVALAEINARRGEIDVVLLDLQMPGKTGFEVQQSLSQRQGKPYVVFMTFHIDDVVRMKLDHTGYDGLILKSDPISAVAEVITRVADGPRPVLHESLGKFSPHPSPELLSESELIVLYLIAVKGLTSREVADKLSRSEETVYKHRKNIMEKLQLHNVQGLVWYAMAIGLHHRPPDGV